MDLKKEFKDNQTILLLTKSKDYNNAVIKVVKNLPNKSIVYVTLNKTNEALEETFKKHKINTDDIVFIDAISETIKKTPSQSKKAYFCSSPGSLTEISLVISKFLKHDFDYIIFDSLTSLLIYQKKAPIAKFVSSLINKIKQSKTKAVFYALNLEEQSELIEEAGSFVDKVVQY